MTARLLWVDDEIEMLRAHIIFLEKKGYTVSTASNGSDALDLCRDNAFDLILLDENMPGLSGLETLGGIKEILPNVPVVMVTKNEAEDLMDQAIGSKIADYLIKPVNPNQILLALKKHIHARHLEHEVSETAYRQDFGRIGMQLSDALDHEEWAELYKRLVRWELELPAEGAMNEMLQMQKEEANQAFAKYIRREYPRWISGEATSRPLLSHEVLGHTVFPRLRQGRRVFLLVLDNLRFDQWRTISAELSDSFDIDERLCYSLLPTATQYARNALFAGLLPADIRRLHPDLWVEEEDEEGKNLCEDALLAHHLRRHGLSIPFTYHKLSDTAAADRLLSSLPRLLTTPFNALVVNFVDILSHARTESKMVRELVANEAAYRSITLSWFRHSPIRSLFQTLAEAGCDIVVTTDHGSIRTDTPLKVIGEKSTNTNLRYKTGRNLGGYQTRDVFEVKRPELIGLPAPRLSTTYIFATGNRFFAYPNNYNHYVSYYRGTFQHGGISMEEMIVPLAILRPKQE
ncbi:MAG: PglZ domain-containing protein [Alloprevotella sp.]